MMPIAPAPGPRDGFAEMAARPTDAIELDRACLLIAAEEYPGLDIDRYLGKLEALGERIRSRLYSDAGPHETIAVLRQVLVDEEGFSGNDESYYDPRNSYLNEVLDRHIGIPITLSTIYIEVSRRVGFALEGVGFPGHFLVKHTGPSAEIVVDPFHGGRIVERTDLRSQLQRLFGEEAVDEARFLRAATRRELLFRMLKNLKAIYLRQNDTDRALAAVERMLLLMPEAPEEHRDCGVLLARLERSLEALRELRLYRELSPDAKDGSDVDALIDRLRLKVTMQN